MNDRADGLNTTQA